MNSTASLKEAPPSQTTFKKANTNHESCSSFASFHYSFASIDDESFTLERTHSQQDSTCVEEWIEERIRSHQDDFQLDMAHLISDFDQLGGTSMSSIKTEEYNGYDSILVTKRRMANHFTLTLEPESSSDDEDSISDLHLFGAEAVE